METEAIYVVSCIISKAIRKSQSRDESHSLTFWQIPFALLAKSADKPQRPFKMLFTHVSRVFILVSILFVGVNGDWWHNELKRLKGLLRKGALRGRVSTTSPPEQIHMSFTSSPSEMIVQWAVVGGPSDGCVVEWGLEQSRLTNSAKASGATYSLSNHGYPSYTSPMLYKAKMTGLHEGNSVYYYRVGCGSTFSSTYSFKTHPGVGKNVGKPVTFHIIGDLGQTVNSQNTLKELIDNEKALTGGGFLSGGIISMGDLSYANGNEPLWDSYGKMAQMATSTIPYVTTLGNHEWFDDDNNLFTAYKARFSNPPIASTGKTELYYSFDSGLVHWVMVAGYCTQMKSVNTQPCLAPDSAELKWLQADLAGVDKSKTPWTFVVFHQPYYNSNTAHDMASEGAPMQQAIEETLYNAKVDFVMAGHGKIHFFILIFQHNYREYL